MGSEDVKHEVSTAEEELGIYQDSRPSQLSGPQIGSRWQARRCYREWREWSEAAAAAEPGPVRRSPLPRAFLTKLGGVRLRAGRWMGGWVVSVGAGIPETGARRTGAERQGPKSPFRAWVSQPGLVKPAPEPLA